MMLKRVLIFVFVLVSISTFISARKPSSDNNNINFDEKAFNDLVELSENGFYSLRKAHQKRGPNFPNWMSQNKNILINKQLKQIFLPGTHDSGAYQLSSDVLPNYTDQKTMQLLDTLKKFNLPTDKLLIPWSLAQDKDIYDQLSAGARYIDLRAGWDGKNWRTFHLFMGNNIDVLLDQIKRFLDDNREEYVFVSVSHFIGVANGPNEREALAKMIESKLGQYLFPRGSPMTITYGQVLASGKRAFVSFADDSIVNNHPDLWNDWMVFNTYADSNNFNDVLKYNKDRLGDFNNAAWDPQLYKISWTITPDAKNVQDALNPFGRSPKSLNALGDSINGKNLDDFINLAKSTTQKKIPGNVMIFDHFQTANIQSLIDLNKM